MTDANATPSAAKPDESAIATRRSRKVVAFWTVIAVLQIPLIATCGFTGTIGAVAGVFGVSITERTSSSSSSCPRWRPPSIGASCSENRARCQYGQRGWVRSHPPVFICRGAHWDLATESDFEIQSL